MRPLLLLTLMLARGMSAQTWTDRGSGTQIVSLTPQNCNNTGSPSYCNGVIFPYADQQWNIIAAWGGAASGVISSVPHMFIVGGGHAAYFGNEIYDVNLVTNTATRLTDPSIPPAAGSPVTTSNISCPGPNADITPMSIHTYGQVAWMSQAGKMFLWDAAGNNYCGVNPPTYHVWEFDPLAKTWALINNSFNLTKYSSPQFADCTLDTSFGVTAHESVVCAMVYGGGVALLRWDSVSNTWTTLNAYGTLYPYAGSLAIDATRKIGIVIGSTLGGALSVVKVDLSNSSYTFTDITSSTTGCSALNVNWPGLAYNNIAGSVGAGNFMAWPNSGNTVYEFNPDTKACTAHTASGGPPAPIHANAGTFGRFAAIPSGFAVVNSTTNNAFVFDPGTPPTITNPASAGAITAGTQNSAYSYTFAASGTLPFTWSITNGAPPTGVSLNSATGALSGTPTTPGNFSFTISVTNGFGSPAAQNATLAIAAVCLITSSTMPSGKFNVPYSQTVPTAGCTSPTFAVTAGSMPTGLTLHTDTGVVDGTPTVSGLFSFTVGVTDMAGDPSQATSITVIPGPGVFNVMLGAPWLYR